jgi:hypothetical protein
VQYILLPKRKDIVAEDALLENELSDTQNQPTTTPKEEASWRFPLTPLLKQRL